MRTLKEFIECNNCKWYKTLHCPNSSKCYSKKNKPFFAQKGIPLHGKEVSNVEND